MRGVTLFGVLMMLGGCGTSDSLAGSAEVAVEMYDATWTMTPSRCVSGEHQGFLGVDLLEGDDESTLLRLVLDPVDGYSLGTNVPGEDVALFVTEVDGCELFDVAVARQNSRINNYWNVAGHVLVDCSLPGLELHADIQFANCH